MIIYGLLIAHRDDVDDSVVINRSELFLNTNDAINTNIAVDDTLHISDGWKLNIEETRLSEKEMRAMRLREQPDDYFDPKRFYRGDDPEYRRKVIRSHMIACWVYSNRKNDPEFRKLLIILLENGYDIDDFGNVAKSIAFSNEEVESIKQEYRKLGIHSEEEIMDIIKISGALERQKRREEIARNTLIRLGITHQVLLDELWSLDLGLVYQNDGTIGNGELLTLWGDKLLTDDDWMDEEFIAAKNRYSWKRQHQQSTKMYEDVNPTE